MELDTNNGLEKAAILLIALGAESAAEILKILTPKEVQRLGHAMAEQKSVPRDRIEEVLDEFLGYLHSTGWRDADLACNICSDAFVFAAAWAAGGLWQDE